jgi:GNAT superfamily N-acetyltransferase
MTALQTPPADPRAIDPLAGRFRAMRGSASDTAMIEGWAGGAGWSLGRGDLELFTRHRPGGLLIGLLDDRPVSAMATAGYDNGFCFTGALIVDPGFRGRGIGAATADTVLSRLAGLTVGLEAPPRMRDFFAARGFFTRWRTIAFAGAVPVPRLTSPHVVPLDADLLGQAAAFDARCFPADRTPLAIDWVGGRDRYALGFVHNNRLLGYGVIRPGRGAARIGPLYATEPRVAAAVFDALAEHAGRHGARAIAIDIPEPNPAAMALCETRGLSHDTETLRMIRPSPQTAEPSAEITPLYGLTSRELG